jgi:osmoprotectant transport system permease protein
VPVGALLLALYLAVFGGTLPALNWTFLGLAALGGLGQILGTNLLIMAFGFRGFAVGTAYAKSEAVQGALLAFLITFYARIGLLPALTALFLYGLLPIVSNTCAGLEAIPRSLRDSAIALGLPRSARLLRIELPLALGAILAGVQTSAVINVGTATIAAFIGAGGYGERIATGLALNDTMVLLAGALPAAGLALLVQLAFGAIERLLLPPTLRGLRT